MTLLAWEMNAIVQWLAHSLVLPFLGIGMRIDLFQSCGHCWTFQICWRNEHKTLMASSFRDLNSSTGIWLHPLTLLTAVLLKAHLTLFHSVWFWVTNYTIVIIWLLRFFYTILPCILSISSWSLKHLLFMLSLCNEQLLLLCSRNNWVPTIYQALCKTLRM